MNPTYSFLDVQAVLSGLGGIINLGEGSGSAEEGISYEFEGDKTDTQTGADGTIMHSLIASQTGIITCRFLKNSPTNGKLMDMLNLQKGAGRGAAWGNNILSINHNTLGDQIVMVSAAFVRIPNNSYANKGNVLEWQLKGQMSVALGRGIMSNLA